MCFVQVTRLQGLGLLESYSINLNCDTYPIVRISAASLFCNSLETKLNKNHDYKDKI